MCPSLPAELGLWLRQPLALQVLVSCTGPTHTHWPPGLSRQPHRQRFGSWLLPHPQRHSLDGPHGLLFCDLSDVACVHDSCCSHDAILLRSERIAGPSCGVHWQAELYFLVDESESTGSSIPCQGCFQNYQQGSTAQPVSTHHREHYHAVMQVANRVMEKSRTGFAISRGIAASRWRTNAQSPIEVPDSPDAQATENRHTNSQTARLHRASGNSLSSLHTSTKMHGRIHKKPK